MLVVARNDGHITQEAIKLYFGDVIPRLQIQCHLRDPALYLSARDRADVEAQPSLL